MDVKNEMTASESLALIAETMNNSRKEILRGNAKYFVLWGCLLTVMSLVVYFLWHLTGSPRWNFLWFAMPVIGYPLAAMVSRNDKERPQSEIGRITGNVWSVFGAFAICISAIAIAAVPMHVTLILIIIFGFAESVSGAVLKNWPIIIGGFLIGVGGAVAAVFLKSEAQILLFTIAGVLLAGTGLIVKLQYK